MFDEFLRTHELAALLLNREARRAFPACEDRDRWQNLPSDVQRELLAWGDEAVREGYPMVTATQFMAFVRTGDRQVFEKPYFARRDRLIGAALSECVQNDGAYLDAVVDGLWCILEESSWVLSAHNIDSHPGARPASEQPLPDVQNPVIDLFAAQTAATLAYVVSLLQTKLDRVSPLLCRRVRLEVEGRIFLPFLTRDDYWWMGVVRKDVNNWTPWIVSNVMDAMLLLLRDDARLCEGLSRGMRMLDHYLDVMPSDGGCDEGCGYWNMAGGALLDCLESLYGATGGQVDFYREPLIRMIGAFPAMAHIAGEWFWNFADCDARPAMDGERMYRYGLRTENESLMALGAEVFHRRGASVRPMDTPQMNRVLFALFQPPPEAKPVPPRSLITLPALQVYAQRSQRLYIAMKGGHNAESHNHNDVGSFILYVDGEPQVVDAGNLCYTAKTFSDERYTLWNTRSCNHNVPLIDGMEQPAGREYCAKDIRVDGETVSMSLVSAYPASAGLSRFTRELRMQGDEVTVTDDITLWRDAPITWVFLLRHRPEGENGELHFGKTKLCYDGALTLETEEIPVTDARMARSFPGSLWRITLTSAPKKAHKRSFRMLPI